MAWLLHPNDFAELCGLARTWNPCGGHLPPGGVAIGICCCLARGHIQDTDHPELGTPTFAEYGEAHAKIMEAERVRFEQTLAAIEKYMTPMPPLPFPRVP